MSFKCGVRSSSLLSEHTDLAEQSLLPDGHYGVTLVRVDAGYPYQTAGMSEVHDSAKHGSQARSGVGIVNVDCSSTGMPQWKRALQCELLWAQRNVSHPQAQRGAENNGCRAVASERLPSPNCGGSVANRQCSPPTPKLVGCLARSTHSACEGLHASDSH
jgi:hypothetical protein